MSTLRGLRATVTAGLVAAAVLLAPAGIAFAGPSTDASTPTPTTTTGSTDVAHGAYRPCGTPNGKPCKAPEKIGDIRGESTDDRHSTSFD